MHRLLSLFLISFLIACGGKEKKNVDFQVDQLPNTGDSENTTPFLRLFPSLTKWDGASGKELPFLDTGCTADAQRLGLKGIYKAMVSTEKRIACKSADCSKLGLAEALDWVLLPKTEYRREDGKTIIGETNERGIFDFPLENSISVNAQKIWTGLADYWTSPYYSFESCAGLANCRETGFIGEASAVSAELLKKTSILSCKEKLSVICVEQPLI